MSYGVVQIKLALVKHGEHDEGASTFRAAVIRWILISTCCNAINMPVIRLFNVSFKAVSFAVELLMLYTT